MSHAKIVRDFHAVIKDFQKAQRVCIEREGMYAPGAGVGDAAEAAAAQAKAEAENAPLVPRPAGHMQSAQFGLLDADHSYHAHLLQVCMQHLHPRTGFVLKRDVRPSLILTQVSVQVKLQVTS